MDDSDGIVQPPPRMSVQHGGNNNNNGRQRPPPNNTATSHTSATSAQPLPPAYAFQRSERNHGDDGRGGGGGGGTSFATAEDTLASSSCTDGRSVDCTEYSAYSAQQESVHHDLGRRREEERTMMGTARDGRDQTVDDDNLTTVEEYHQEGNNDAAGIVDATAIIHRMHHRLLHLLSEPRLFHDAIDWQDRSTENRGGMMMDPSNNDDASDVVARRPPMGNVDRDASEDRNVSRLTNRTFETDYEEEEDDSTFRGLGIAKDDEEDEEDEEEKEDGNVRTTHSQNETFEFNPNADDEGGGNKDPKVGGEGGEEATKKPREPPLPHQIFAPDAEVVLPQALTASQLFGIERFEGVELEAASGISGLSQLFLRWLALMPEGDHENVVDPPGLTVMKIRGGGYRVTGAHRVVWRWMNKFSPVNTSVRDPDTGQLTVDTDFDFGDLVTMTIVDVFETDADGKLLSYCPTFDNRAVHKTPEMAERLRKSVVRARERAQAAATSPAGKTAGRFVGVGVRAALVMGNAVKNKIRQHNMQGREEQKGVSDSNVPEEEQLNELLHSQIASDDTVADINEVNATALEDDPTISSPERRRLV